VLLNKIGVLAQLDLNGSAPFDIAKRFALQLHHRGKRILTIQPTTDGYGNVE
jgi:hypothetical protein